MPLPADSSDLLGVTFSKRTGSAISHPATQNTIRLPLWDLMHMGSADASPSRPCCLHSPAAVIYGPAIDHQSGCDTGYLAGYRKTDVSSDRADQPADVLARLDMPVLRTAVPTPGSCSRRHLHFTGYTRSLTTTALIFRALPFRKLAAELCEPLAVGLDSGHQRHG